MLNVGNVISYRSFASSGFRHPQCLFVAGSTQLGARHIAVIEKKRGYPRASAYWRRHLLNLSAKSRQLR